MKTWNAYKDFINNWLKIFNDKYGKNYQLRKYNSTYYIEEIDERGGVIRQLQYGTLRELAKAVELWNTLDCVLYRD